MNNFTFKNPTKLIFGKGQISQITDEINKDTKVMVTYGGGSIKKNGIYDQVMAALKGYDVVEFGGIEANPQYSTLMKAVEIGKKEKIDLLLAVGGGSTIDGTKFIATAINYESDPWEFMLDQSILGSITPVKLATVLTLPATGSEMNCGAVISRKEREEKFAFMHPLNYPQFSVLDPQACYSLPKKQIANGVVDTFVHTLEQYLTYPANGMIQDRFAEGVLLTLKEIGADLLENQTSYDLASNFMLSATMGLNGFIAMGVPEDWATHMIGHELTAIHGLDHGVTLAIVGPSLINVMREEKCAKILQYGERVWGITAGGEQERIDATIAGLFESRGWNLGENQSITPAKVMEILEGAL